MIRKIILTLLLLMAVTLVGVPQASAVPTFKTWFETNYSSAVNSRIDACLLCHVDPDPLTSGITTRNPYGLDFGHGHNFTAIEPLDSDGDGFINIDEIHNLTFPGNTSDHPTVIVAANGTIAGNVTNASSGMAIPGATVTANGTMATTDTNGSYSISIAAGIYNVTASMTGYQTNTTTGVVVTSGNVTTQDFALTPTAPIVTGPQLVLILNASSSGSKASNFTSAVLLDKTGAIVESASSISANGLTTTFNLTGIMPDFYFIEVNGLSGDRVPTFIDNNATNISQLVTKGLTTTTVGDATNLAKYRIKARSGGRHPIVNYFTGENETGLPFVIVYNDTSPGKIEVREVNTSRLLTNFTPSSLSDTVHASLEAGVTFQSWQLNLGASLPGFTGLLNHGQIYNNTDSLCNGCHGTNMNTKPVNYSDVGTGFASGANSGGSGWCFKCHYGGTNGGDTNGFVDPTVIVAANGTIAGNVTNASSGMAIPGTTVTANGTMATTDTNGSYSISIAAGTYTVTASATGYQTNTTTGVVVTAGNVTTQNFALTPTVPIAVPTFNISGFKINNATGSGVQGWNITLMNSTMQTSMLTGANGSYMFTGIVNGTYNVTEGMMAGWTNVSPMFQQVTINGTDVMNVNFTNTLILPSNRSFIAHLVGNEEVPPVVTSAEGQARFELSDNGTMLRFNVTVTNITNATVSHIHLAPVGVNGSIVVILYPGPTKVGRFDGVLAEGNITQANLTGPLAGQPLSALLDNITAGNTYVNVHTTQHPGGEIRGQIMPAVAPSPATFSISGFKINNATGSGIPGWNITLTNSTMQMMSALTDINGSYMFTNLANGTYNVTEEMRTGWTNVSPMSQQVTINGADMMNINFTNQPIVQTFNISGFKINDTNGNGVWDPREMGIENWNINLLNATTGTQIASTSTNAQGFYEFMNLTPGIYNVTEEMKPGFAPSGATFKVVTIENMDVTDVDFLNHITVIPPVIINTISGFKINAANGMGLPGWNIKLIGIVPGTAGINMETTTDDQGFYSFGNLPAGMYLVVETLKGGYVPSGSPVLVVNLEKGMNSMNNNFMNRPISSLIPSMSGMFG